MISAGLKGERVKRIREEKVSAERVSNLGKNRRVRGIEKKIGVSVVREVGREPWCLVLSIL